MISWDFNMKLVKNIALQGVTFSFAQQNKHFFDNLHVEFRPGSINFIQGKNGVGKSTLLQIFSGKMHQEHSLQGALQVGLDMYNLSESYRIEQVVAFVPQNFNELLVDAYSFYENLQFVHMSKYPSLCALPVINELPKLIEKYGIDYTIPVSLLSGGQRQILSMLMVLERLPKILLLDEPTAALDEENTKLVMDFLQDLCKHQGMTIIAIVHNQELVDAYSSSGFFELINNDGKRDINFNASKI